MNFSDRDNHWIESSVLVDTTTLHSIFKPVQSDFAQKILSFPSPPIPYPSFALQGEVKHQNWTSDANLEMYCLFPGGRTLIVHLGADRGPAKKLDGDSDWRVFRLPCLRRVPEGLPDQQPERIELHAKVPEGSFIQLRNVRLVAFREGDNPLLLSNAWWPPTLSSYLFWGYLLLLLFATLFCLKLNYGKTFVFIILAVSSVSVLVGAYALSKEQPGHIVQFFSLPPTIAIVFIGFNRKKLFNS